MKLSEAVRMGSQWADCYGPVVAQDRSCCAIGGIIKAIGGERNLVICEGMAYAADELRTIYPMLNFRVTLPADCPGWGPTVWRKGDLLLLSDAIIYLFEGARWSKKAIAEWVETIEKQMEPHAPVAQGDQVPLGGAVGDAAHVSAQAEPVSVVL